MTVLKSATKDPVYGVRVDEATSLQAERDGKTLYFSGDQCRKKLLSRRPVLSRTASLDE